MRINFYGAAQTVTGSMMLWEYGEKKILVECGLYQGKRKVSEKLNREFPFDPKSIDLVLISHAHIDHSGNLPNLVKQGYSGEIISTYASIDLMKYMLLDSAHIHEKDVEYLNKKLLKRKEALLEPLYDVEDAEKTIKLFKGLNYYTPLAIAEDLKVTFIEAGHILGSAQLLFEYKDKTVLFTGDLGRSHMPIIRNPDIAEDVDLMITETTYGDREHKSILKSKEELKGIVNETCKRGGKIIIPAFSVGRTQELLYDLYHLRKNNEIDYIEIFVDSPLSSSVTKVFKEHPECYDNDMMEIFNENSDPFEFNGLKYVTDVNESKLLNSIKKPIIIISASGMCEAGRILHHLKNNIEEKKNTVLITGFMAEDTLGRRIVEKNSTVKIFGEEYRLNAEVKIMNEYSAHADSKDLVAHIASSNPKKIVMVHGELKQQESLKIKLNDNGFKDVMSPKKGDSVVV